MKTICNHCGSLNTLKNKSEGRSRGDWFLMLLIFCFFFAWIFILVSIGVFIIGVIALFLSKPKRKFTVCKSCGAENSFVNIETPKGKELLEQYHKDIKKEEVKPLAKEQTWHGLW